MKRSRVHARRGQAAAAAAAGALTLALAGCSTFSPATISTPYQAADGTTAAIPDSQIKLVNFLVVSAAKGEPGQVLGAVVNEGDAPAVVAIQTDLGASAQFSQAQVKVRGHGITQVGPSGTEVTVSDTPAEPGALMTISAQDQRSGGVSLTVPVVAPSGYYSSYTVVPTTEPAPGESGTPGESETSTGSVSPEGTKTSHPSSEPTAS